MTFEIFDFPEEFCAAELRCPFCGSPQAIGCDHHILATYGRNYTESHLLRGFVAAGMKHNIFQKYIREGAEALTEIIHLIESESDLSVQLKQRCPIKKSVSAQVFYCSSEEKSREVCQAVNSLLRLGERRFLSAQDHLGNTTEAVGTARTASSPAVEDDEEFLLAVASSEGNEESFQNEYDIAAEETNSEILAEMQDDMESSARSDDSGWYYADDDR
jgi:hypothetical protein